MLLFCFIIDTIIINKLRIDIYLVRISPKNFFTVTDSLTDSGTDTAHRPWETAKQVTTRVPLPPVKQVESIVYQLTESISNLN